MLVLRDYQSRGVEGIRSVFRSDTRRVCYVLPCAGGKTVIFSYISDATRARGNRVLILAHRIELIEQISGTLADFGVEHGCIVAGRSMNRLPVQVGMIQTVANRLERIADPYLIVVDEGHHSLSKSHRKILDRYPNAFVLLVTATPARTDGRGMGEVCQALVLGPSMRELIDAGYLSPYALFAPPSEIDLQGVKTTAGDYQRGELASRVDRAAVTGDAVQHYRRLAPGAKFVAFCVSREHAAHVAEQFSGAGIPTRNLDGTMGMEERGGILADLRAGRIRGVTSCDLIGEGYDLPSIGAAILLRPTKSLIVYIQQVGRALRLEDGKERAVILDHAGNSLRFGLPDADREWSLEGTRGTKKAAPEIGISIRHCRACFCVYPGHLDRCPYCLGLAATKSRKLEEREGELVEITAEMEKEGLLRCVSYKEALARCETPEDIRLMAAARKYRAGWAIKQTAARFGVPDHEAARMLGYKPSAAFMGVRR